LSSNREHLIEFVTKKMQQRFRMDEKYISYQEAKNEADKAYKRHKQLKELMLETDARANYDKAIRDYEKMELMLSQEIHLSDKKIKEITDEVYFHLLELTNMEISKAGFIAHIIMHDTLTDFDKETKAVTFNADVGNAEAPIATVQPRWKDGSQWIIRKKEVKK